MKGPFKNKQGSTLLEIIVAIAILGLMVAPVCSSLVLSHRLNADSEKTLQARLLVESTVEQLMAEGLVYEKLEADEEYKIANALPEEVEMGPSTLSEVDKPWYTVTVKVDDVEVSTEVRVTSATVLDAEEGGDAE